MVFAYYQMGSVIALNVETINSFYLVVMSGAYRMLNICVTIICCENVSFGSRVILRILRCFVVGNVWLFNLSDRIMPNSAGTGVTSMVVVFFVFI